MRNRVNPTSILSVFPIWIILTFSCSTFANTNQLQSQLTADIDYFGAIVNSRVPVFLDDNGRITFAEIKLDYTVNGITFKAGTGVYFYPDGTVRSGNLKSNQSIDEIQFAAGIIEFHSNGRVKKGKTAAEVSAKNLKLPMNVTLSLSSNGNILSVDSDSEITLLNSYVANTIVLELRDERYSIKSATFNRPKLIATYIQDPNPFGTSQNIPVVLEGKSLMVKQDYAPDDGISDVSWTPAYTKNIVINEMNFGSQPTIFVKGNKIIRIRVANDVIINDRKYSKGTNIWLTPYGKIAT